MTTKNVTLKMDTSTHRCISIASLQYMYMQVVNILQIMLIHDISNYGGYFVNPLWSYSKYNIKKWFYMSKYHMYQI